MAKGQKSLIKEVVVVEGIHDQQRVQSIYPEIDCIVTNGSVISEDTIALIAQAKRTRGVILFLDPDFPGKKIMNQILSAVPGCKIAFLNKKDAISKNRKKVGVEHAKTEDIRQALEALFEVREANPDPVSADVLIALGLLNGSRSQQLRKVACEALRIPFCNGKTFLKTINMLAIPVSRIVEVMQK